MRIELFGDEVEELITIDALTGRALKHHDKMAIYPKSHFVTPRDRMKRAVESIKAELEVRRTWLEREGRLLEAQRLHQRTMFDLEMIQEIGYCHGIENYARHLSGRAEGQPPPTLLDYVPDDALLIIDESHQTVPQIRGMFRGDRQRKEVLVEYGFRLPSALDNRPLTFREWARFFFPAFDQPEELVDPLAGTGTDEHASEPGTRRVRRPPGALRLRDARLLRTSKDGGGVRRAGDPTDRPRRPTHRAAPGARSGGRPPGRDPDQGGGQERVLVTTLTKRMAEDLTQVLSGTRSAGPLPALGHRYARAGRDSARPAAGHVRRARGHQPAPRRARSPRGVAGRGVRCRQGGLPPFERVVDPDDRPGGAQRQREGYSLRGHDDRLDAAGDRRNGAAPGSTAGLQRGPTASRRPRSSRPSTTSR